jgi:uncharacterized damage-inducible protein DinB
VNRQLLSFLSITALFALFVGVAPALAAPSPPAADTAKADFLDRLNYYERRFVSLAEAVPADKYTWRPNAEVRSISEVYLHVAAANYNFPHFLGTEPPAGLNLRGFDKSTTDKARIIQALKDSFAHYRQAVEKLSDADLEKTVSLFGKEHSYRYVFIFTTGHWGEHLGQSIAYARSIGVVPPWSQPAPAATEAKPKP